MPASRALLKLPLRGWRSTASSRVVPHTAPYLRAEGVSEAADPTQQKRFGTLRADILVIPQEKTGQSRDSCGTRSSGFDFEHKERDSTGRGI